MDRFETNSLGRSENFALSPIFSACELARCTTDNKQKSSRRHESSEIWTYGEHKGNAWSSHPRCTCCHPLFVLNPGRCRGAPYGQVICTPPTADGRSGITCFDDIARDFAVARDAWLGTRM